MREDLQKANQDKLNQNQQSLINFYNDELNPDGNTAQEFDIINQADPNLNPSNGSS